MQEVEINSNSIVTVEYLKEEASDKMVVHSFDLEDVSYMNCEEIISFHITIILKNGVPVKFHLDDIKDYKTIFSQWTKVKLKIK